MSEHLDLLIHHRKPTYEEVQTVENFMRTWYAGREPDGLDQITIPIMVLRVLARLDEAEAELEQSAAEIEQLNNQVGIFWRILDDMPAGDDVYAMYAGEREES
jgi:hypothetical protein